jgi:hypothetical protein
VVSGFCCGVREIFPLLGFLAAYVGSLLRTFRDNLSVPSSWIKQSKNNAGKHCGILLGLLDPIGCRETSVTTYPSTLRKIPGERRLHPEIHHIIQNAIIAAVNDELKVEVVVAYLRYSTIRNLPGTEDNHENHNSLYPDRDSAPKTPEHFQERRPFRADILCHKIHRAS